MPIDLGIGQFVRPTRESRQELRRNTSFSNLPSPMLAKKGSPSALDRADMTAETKFDGTRVLLVKRGNNVRLFVARGNHTEYTAKYPKLVADGKKLKARNCTLDGEFVFFDRRGNDVFLNISARPETIGSKKFKYVAFDIVEKDGQDTRHLSIEQRKRILDAVVPDNLTIIKESVVVTANKRRFFQEQIEKGLEGVMLKREGSHYVSGRSDSWLKIKRSQSTDVIVKGATQGTGARAAHFGALKCYLPVNGTLKYIGDVGTGFNNHDLNRIKPLLQTRRPFVIEVKFMEWTPDHKMRFPVFLRLRDDKTPQDVMRGSD